MLSKEKELEVREIAAERRYQWLTEDKLGIGELVEKLECDGDNELEDALFQVYRAGASKASDADAQLLAAARQLYFLLDTTADDLAEEFAEEKLLHYGEEES